MTPAAPLVALEEATLALGRTPLAEGVTLGLARGQRACLVGRNGSGKSTLLRALAGELELDAGRRVAQPGARISYLPQQPMLPPEATIAAYVAEGLPADDHDTGRYRIDAMLELLDLDGPRRLGELSGGEGRRTALARCLVADPDVLLLDEPTNHLDLPTIEWLEGELARFSGAVLVVSHDRAFLTAVADVTLWLERGELRRLDAGFAQFDAWAEEVEAEEGRRLARLQQRIRREEHWLAHGITARRRRNQGRLARLAELRASRARLLAARPGTLDMRAAEAERSGRTVVEARHVCKAFARDDGTRVPVVEDFSTRVRRGDRIGIVGPNGAGKTTLARLLIGDLAPDAGEVKLGANLEPVYFDQARESLDPEATAWRTLVPGGGDSLMAGGRQRHVVGYLRDFLFLEEQARQPVKSLSGGERNRLLLARLFARPSNLVVLDEPTNDLDMETLELLVEVLGDYGGTVLVVSHDRDFLDKTVTSVVVMDGDGRAQEYPGGYSDSLRQRRGAAAGRTRLGRKPRAEKRAGRAKRPKPKARQDKLNDKERRELERLPAEIERLSRRLRTAQDELAEPELHLRDPQAARALSEELHDVQAALDRAETRWLELEERRERLRAAGGGR